MTYLMNLDRLKSLLEAYGANPHILRVAAAEAAWNQTLRWLEARLAPPAAGWSPR